jgi:isochorismate hydrolase
MVTDANADHTDEEHNATLVAFCSKFGDIATTDELIARLESIPRVATAVAL